MDDSIESIHHSKFKYVFIPRNIADPVEVHEFEGSEKDFKNVLNLHFAHDKMMEKEKEKLSKDLLTSTPTKSIDEEHLHRAVELSQTTEIISLTLPKKDNNYEAVNAYIDNVGRIKDLPTNARASRITNNNIRGDCFLSRTFDDEEIFKRIDYTLEDYNGMMVNPPSASGRWSQGEALLQLQKQLQGNSNQTEVEKTQHCAHCFVSASDDVKLKKCGRCQKVRNESEV